MTRELLLAKARAVSLPFIRAVASASTGFGLDNGSSLPLSLPPKPKVRHEPQRREDLGGVDSSRQLGKSRKGT